MNKKKVADHCAHKRTKMLCIKARKLVDLPAELIGMIAEYLTKDELRTLRMQYNRKIEQAVDKTFVCNLRYQRWKKI